MALDGVMLGLIADEIRESVLLSKVDKVHQPTRDEIILVMRGAGGVHRLLISVKASGPRIQLTEYAVENPAQPPMLCMLLRKKLGGGRLCDVRQIGSDRVLMLDFDCVNELGDREKLTLSVEIMGRCSNAVLINERGVILEAMKRVDCTMSSQRLILPGMQYELPPAQDKLDIKTADPEEACRAITDKKGERLDKAVLSCVQGVSPVVCREIAYRATRATDTPVDELTGEMTERLGFFLRRLAETARGEGCAATMITDATGRPIDMTFMRVEQYGDKAVTKEYPGFSRMLDDFYHQRDTVDRMRIKAHDMLKVITNACERISRRLAFQRAELEEAAGRERLRLCGDLINANIYRLSKGDVICELENYYDAEGKTERIALDPMLTPAQNAQKYYRDYRKAQTAEKYLSRLIAQGESELEYLDAVLDELSRARDSRELAEIRAELADEGYIKKQKQTAKKQPAALPPIKYISGDGYTILVGRSNRQNDRLTLREASKNDIWLHVSKQPGAHVIISAKGGEIPDSTVEQAAELAAYYSKGRDSGLTAVDFTLVRHVSKPQGAKPGMVIYTDYQTVYVRPEHSLAASETK